jgi:predicted nucleic acid-binding protein
MQNKEYLITPVDRGILEEARQLVIRHTKHRLSTLDAIQLACALRAQIILNEAIIFVTADTDLRNAASAEGLTVNDPETHP